MYLFNVNYSYLLDLFEKTGILNDFLSICNSVAEEYGKAVQKCASKPEKY